MHSTIILRKYESDDASFLEEIIQKTWQYDRFCSSKTARRLAKLYFHNCLRSQTFIMVAVQDNIPVGVIMGRDVRIRPACRIDLRLKWMELTMLCSREGRQVLNAFSKIDETDKDLLKNRGKEYDGELCFFAVREDCRGKGIGKMLFAELLHYMKTQRIQSFYLYTDSSCSYEFYEHQGMTRCGKKEYAVPLSVYNRMEFYLYEYDCE